MAGSSPAAVAALSLMSVLALVGEARAVDGVLEINQACAENAGCFSGDTGGFPVSIGRSGSYRLTSNLDLCDLAGGCTDTSLIAVHAIDVLVGEVSIDLNGFLIIGPTSCSGFPVSGCTNTGTGDGIRALGHRNITVRNGTIKGRNRGVALTGYGARIEGLRVEQNGSHGIEIDSDSIVSESQAIANGANGIFGSLRNRVNGSVASGNTLQGIRMGNAAQVERNVASKNGDNGLLLGQGCTVIGNDLIENGGDGLFVEAGSLVMGNTASFNTAFGLNMNSDTSTNYLQNVVSGNGSTVSGGTNNGGNLCNAGACP